MTHTLLATLIAKEEGFFVPGTIPARRMNPGDLLHSPHSQHPGGAGHENDIGTIDTAEHGWADLERQLQIFAAKGMNLHQTIYTWAPAGGKDGNHPDKYLSDIIIGLAHAGYARFGEHTLLTEILQVMA